MNGSASWGLAESWNKYNFYRKKNKIQFNHVSKTKFKNLIENISEIANPNNFVYLQFGVHPAS